MWVKLRLRRSPRWPIRLATFKVIIITISFYHLSVTAVVSLVALVHSYVVCGLVLTQTLINHHRSYIWQHTVVSRVNIHSLVFPVGFPFAPLKTSNERKCSIFNETTRHAPPFTPCYYLIPIFNTIGLNNPLSRFPLPAKDIFMSTCIHERILTLNVFFYGKQLPLLTYRANAG